MSDIHPGAIDTRLAPAPHVPGGPTHTFFPPDAGEHERSRAARRARHRGDGRRDLGLG
ncbi:MAG: hypothetical protein ACM3S1_07665 [Hyphomicrobiales bacterium]